MGRMSEKKFLLNTMKVPYEILQNNKPMHLIDVVILLNSLLEENEELKQQLDKIPPRIKEIWLNG